MARYTGAVRFPDGMLMFFVYSGTVDQARPRLFSTVQAADDAWDDTQGGIKYYDADPVTDEDVEVMPYYSNDDHEVMFCSRANRKKMLITGAPSLDRAIELSINRSR